MPDKPTELFFGGINATGTKIELINFSQTPKRSSEKLTFKDFLMEGS